MTKNPEIKKPFAPQAAWRERNPKAVWAQAALRSALKRGLLKQEPCTVCGDPETEAHHPNYDEPARVVWYCRGHHKAVHAKLKAEAKAEGRAA